MRLSLLIVLGLVACNPPIRTCEDAVTCEDCLTISGCSFTGDECADGCRGVGECYGPDNPSQLTCPTSDSGS